MAETLAQELYSANAADKFNEEPVKLDPDTGLDWASLPMVWKLQAAWREVKTDRFFTRQRNIKSNGVFELFSHYSGKTATEMREDLIQYVYDNNDSVKSVYGIAKPWAPGQCV